MTTFPDHVVQGQRWRLDYPEGRQVAYTVDMAEFEKSPGHQKNNHYVKLRNDETGDFAWQSIGTLRGVWRDPILWVFVGEAELETPLAA